MRMLGVDWTPFREEFPHLFEGKEFLSFWVGQGWTQILWELCVNLEAMARQRSSEGHPPIRVSQVQQRNGSLCFDLVQGNCRDEINALIDVARKRSGATCEACGKPGKIQLVPFGFKAYCSTHLQEAEASVGFDPAPGDVIYEDGGYDLSLAKRSVGRGWHGIIERLFLVKPEWIKVIQVKEKFGGLRCYLDDGTVRADCINLGSFTIPTNQVSLGEDQASQLLHFRKMVREAEAESFKVCESCGSPGTIRRGDWISTLCDRCENNRRSVLAKEQNL